MTASIFITCRIPLIHWGKLTTIGSDNGLLPSWHQAIIWTSAGILLIGPLGTNLSEIFIRIHIFSRRCIWKCCWENGDPFVSASIYLSFSNCILLQCHYTKAFRQWSPLVNHQDDKNNLSTKMITKVVLIEEYHVCAKINIKNSIQCPRQIKSISDLTISLLLVVPWNLQASRNLSVIYILYCYFDLW